MIGFNMDFALREDIDRKVYELLLNEAFKKALDEWDVRDNKEFIEYFSGCATNRADFIRQRMLVHLAQSHGVEVSGLEDYGVLPLK